MNDLVYLAHYGVKGMLWGFRKYQNEDGSLTPLGRKHYGVGDAIKKIGGSIRKRIAPTNAELNAKIRKQKSKNLNKQKKNELKELKKQEGKESKSPNKRFSEMSDREIKDRINRLRDEVTLADLERTKNFGPGRRMVDDIVKSVAKDTATRLLSKVITDSGSKAITEWLKTDSDRLRDQAINSVNRTKIRNEKSELAKAYKSTGTYSDRQIANLIGVDYRDLGMYLKDKEDS